MSDVILTKRGVTDRRYGPSKSLKDISGNKFGSLLVIKRAENKGKAVMWLCKCDCGETVSIRGNHLRKGQTHCAKCTPRNHNVTHGLHKHPSYVTWTMMKQRCENPNAIGYANYGGRGIVVCERWHDFEFFVEDVGTPPSKNHTLDRIDIDGNYEPSNVRWATHKEQMRNKRNNRVIEYRGEKKTVTEWGEILCIPRETIFARLKMGWELDKIFTTKPRPVVRYIEYNGESLTVKEWSDKIGISINRINNRIYAGWAIDKVLSSKKYKPGIQVCTL